MKIDFSTFVHDFQPEKSGQCLFDGRFFEKDKSPIMKLAAAADEKRVATMTFDPETGNFVVKAGLNFNGKGFFITKEPVPSEFILEM